MISLANDLSAEQNVLMNLFFAAHQHNIIVDVASLGDPIPILQQASDITAGTHMFIEKPELLLKDLMQNCLVNSSESHEVFNRSDPTIIDYRAACHCHHKLVQIGYVCSVCLTIQCVFTPICPTCNAIFSLPTTGPKKAKKRKKDA
uniref:General transcription factor IIH subunit 3 n=1 Tax=Acrobeloides nanus TaxID=290746 RepID=A0A914DA66_9BILA